MFEYLPVPKQAQTNSNRVKLTQKQKGDINAAADAKLKARSHGICELCGDAWAVQRAHLIGRGHIDHKTTASDLAHVCVPCHKWFDEDPRGIQVRRLLASIIEHHEGRESDGSGKL